MRSAIHRFDEFLCHQYGIFEFTQEKDCILRLQLTRAPHPIYLAGEVVKAGEPVAELHLWNERIPTIPPEGPTLGWAAHLKRLFIHSLGEVARYIDRSPQFAGVRLVGGVTSVFTPDPHTGGGKFLLELGFTVMPYYQPQGRFGEFWENFYAWWMIWAYNPGGLQRRQMLHMRRTEMWMSVEEFHRRFGKEGFSILKGEAEEGNPPARSALK